MTRISCIVPVFDGEKYLRETLTSILDQTQLPHEVVVVDNGCTDSSVAIARSFGPPVRVVSQPLANPAAARNRGIREANGDLLAFLDADDLYLPGKLRRQVEHLAETPGLDVSLCLVENFWTEALAAERRRYEAAGRTHGSHHLGALLASARVFERVGPLDETRRHGDQVEWFARARDMGVTMEALPDVLARRRMHPESLSHREPQADDFLDFAAERIARRRARS